MFDKSNIVEVPAVQDPRWQAVVARGIATSTANSITR
jgi:hypothetical protein